MPLHFSARVFFVWKAEFLPQKSVWQELEEISAIPKSL